MASWALWLACLALLVARALPSPRPSPRSTAPRTCVQPELITLRPRAGRRVQRQKTEREATAAAIRVGMAVCGCLAAAMAALTPPRLMDLSWLGTAPWLVWGSSVVTALFIGILASLLDVAGRTLASRAPDRWAMRLSGYVAFLVFTLYPPMRFLVGLINLVVRPFGGRIRFESPPPPLEELEKLLAAQAAGGQVDKGAPQLIRSIFELSDKRCKDVMVPRTEVVSVDVATPPAEILRLLGEEGHSRLPVFRDDVDRIIGVLHTPRLDPAAPANTPRLIVLADVVRPATFVPWMKPIGDLLREMQKKRIHMAIVVDEYGGFMGIVTLEDILEEIVGEIGDEFDVEKTVERPAEDGSFLVEAGLEVADFSRKRSASRCPRGTTRPWARFISSLAGAISRGGRALPIQRLAIHGAQQGRRPYRPALRIQPPQGRGSSRPAGQGRQAHPLGRWRHLDGTQPKLERRRPGRSSSTPASPIAALSALAVATRGAPWPWAAAAGVATLSLLLVMLLDRRTVWIAAGLGSALAGLYCGLLAWALWSRMGAVLGGLAGSVLAASAYVPLLRPPKDRDDL